MRLCYVSATPPLCPSGLKLLASGRGGIAVPLLAPIHATAPDLVSECFGMPEMIVQEAIGIGIVRRLAAPGLECEHLRRRGRLVIARIALVVHGDLLWL